VHALVALVEPECTKSKERIDSMAHRLWAECEPTVNAYCNMYAGSVPSWSDRTKTFSPLLVIGILYDMYKCSTLPPLRVLEEALEAEIVSTRHVTPRCIEDFVCMLYSKKYIPTSWDPFDVSALSLMARRADVSPEETCATLCRVFLRSSAGAASKGSASKLVCDALRRGGRVEPNKTSASWNVSNTTSKRHKVENENKRLTVEIEEYDPCNPGIAGMNLEFRMKPLPPPQAPYPSYPQQTPYTQHAPYTSSPQHAPLSYAPPTTPTLDTNMLNALFTSMTNGGIRT
jgi:hypothetical protein